MPHPWHLSGVPVCSAGHEENDDHDDDEQQPHERQHGDDPAGDFPERGRHAMRFGPSGIQDRQGTKNEPQDEDADHCKHRRLGLVSGALQVREVQGPSGLVLSLRGVLPPKWQLVIYGLALGLLLVESWWLGHGLPFGEGSILGIGTYQRTVSLSSEMKL